MKPTILVSTAILLLSISTANAVDPLTATTLKRYCENYAEDPESTLSQKCVAYVGGFLDGAVATDQRVAENVVNEIEQDESFSERAIRTRVYGRLRDYGPSVYADFCIGDPVPIKEVVLHVIEDIASRGSLKGVTAQNVVYASVREHYPCNQSD
jgi:hypothetical protein